MFTRLGVVRRGFAMSACGAVLLSLLLAPGAHADTIRVDDDERGHEAWFLAIKSATFTNGSRD